MPTLRILLVVCFLVSSAANASTLRLTVEHHPVVEPLSAAPPFDNQRSPKLHRVIFVDERISAEVALDVFVVPQLSHSRKSIQALNALDEHWWRKLAWELRDGAGNQIPLDVKEIELVRAQRRDRGPKAVSPADRDTAYDCTSYKAVFRLPFLSTGEYFLRVRLFELQSAAFSFDVRIGHETPAIRDAQLAAQATRAQTWDEFKRIQHERLALEPRNVGVFGLLVDRALQEGTIDEARNYLQSTKAVLSKEQALQGRSNRPDLAQKYSDEMARLAPLIDVLAEYFAHRDQWTIVRGGIAAGYEIRERRTGRLIRRLEPRRPIER